MAVNSLVPWDAYALLNAVAEQATGQKNLTAIDTSSFVSVGEKVLKTGYENTLNAISTVLARTIFSSRPYTSRLRIVYDTPERFGGQVRKIIPIYQGAEQSTDYNTEQNPNQLADNNSVDMYKIRSPKAVQVNFYGSKKLQKHITVYRDQLSMAFTNEAEFMAFMRFMMTGYANEVEILNEAKARALLLNAVGGISASGGTVVDLIEGYNKRNGTALTREEVLNKDNITSYMQYMAAQIKIWSGRLQDMSALNHVSKINGVAEPILRHTPKSMQKMVMYAPSFIEAESMVYSSLFNPSYLGIGSFEGINYWQSQETPTAINVTPVVLDADTLTAEKAGAATTYDYVLGMLYDVEFMGATPQFEYSSTTPFNSAGGYWNVYNHWRFNSWTDYTENAVLFILGPGGAPAAASKAVK